jgi:hypothetical protein
MKLLSRSNYPNRVFLVATLLRKGRAKQPETMLDALGPLVIIIFPFFFILVMIGFVALAKRVKLGFRIRSEFARFFLWLEKSGLFERVDEKEQKEMTL